MNESDVYKAPNADLTKTYDKDGMQDVLEVAKRQKALLYTFLVYILLGIATGVIDPELKLVLQLFVIPVMIAIVVFTARLCLKLYGKTGAIIMIVLSFVPLINLIVLLIANSKANKQIKSKGFRVGLIGANIKEISSAI